MILDDKIHISASTRLDVGNPLAAKALTLAELAPGTFIEAEGNWTAHHDFAIHGSSGIDEGAVRPGCHWFGSSDVK